jgi:hypothetical protein
MAWALALLAGGLQSACAPRAACSGRSYHLRGEVVGAAAPGGAARLLTLRHEPVDDFADRQGKVVGMDYMTMSFPVARRVPLAGIGAGDVVAITLCVDWQADPEVAVTALHRLPAGTRLELRPARPRR